MINENFCFIFYSKILFYDIPIFFKTEIFCTNPNHVINFIKFKQHLHIDVFGQFRLLVYTKMRFFEFHNFLARNRLKIINFAGNDDGSFGGLLAKEMRLFWILNNNYGYKNHKNSNKKLADQRTEKLYFAPSKIECLMVTSLEKIWLEKIVFLIFFSEFRKK